MPRRARWRGDCTTRSSGPDPGRQPRRQLQLRLLSYNVRFGGLGREDHLAAVIRGAKPDLVLLQEATVPAVVERLAAATGLAAWGARPGVSVAFLSRAEVARSEWRLPRPANRPFLEVVLAGSALRVFGVHLTAVHSNWTERRRVRELRGLLAAVARHQDGFHVVAGDFNTLAPGEQLDVRSLPYRLRAFIWLTGRTIRWQTLQLMLDGGYVDCHRRLDPGAPGFTFPTWNPHVRLDYVFLPAAFAERIRRCDVVRDPEQSVAAASDHLPVLAELEL